MRARQNMPLWAYRPDVWRAWVPYGYRPEFLTPWSTASHQLPAAARGDAVLWNKRGKRQAMDACKEVSRKAPVVRRYTRNFTSVERPNNCNVQSKAPQHSRREDHGDGLHGVGRCHGAVCWNGGRP